MTLSSKQSVLKAGELIRVTLNLTSSLIHDIERLASIQNTTRTGVVHEAIKIALYFDRVVQEGGEVLVKRKDNSLVKVDFSSST